jgi:hypothetical protein
MDIDRICISSCFKRRVFGAQLKFQRLMVVSVRIVEVDFKY